MTQPKAAKANQRRVAFATVIGTTVEWYDFFIYATAAGLVFSQLFFEPAGQDIALLISFASVGLSFLFRPLGAFLAGHFGDKIGRRAMLVLTLALMGAATTLIGVLPTYETAGIWAPIMLLLLRILQGISAGGEWGGAVLMAVEHASDGHRGRAGSYPQVGVPLGMLLASGTMALMTGVISPGDAFLEWGWRVPFLVSIILIAVGYFVRRSVDESPVFEEISENKAQTAVPILVLFKKHWPLVIIAALVFAGNNAAGYMIIAFFSSYSSNSLGMTKSHTLIATLIGGVSWLVLTIWSGRVSDKIGRRETFMIGYALIAVWAVPMWFFVDKGELLWLVLVIVVLTFGLAPSYAPQSALYAEMFPAEVRYSGTSISYALGSILGGAFAPMIAQLLLDSTGRSWTIGVYLAAMAIVSGIAVWLVPKSVEKCDLSV